jgi:hypothetical protein
VNVSIDIYRGLALIEWARKRHFLSHLYIKINILPRQARDKHKENSKKVPFSQGSAAAAAAAAAGGGIEEEGRKSVAGGDEGEVELLLKKERTD